MKHFFEQLEREINFPKEYEKLEEMISIEGYNFNSYNDTSVNTWIENNIRKWRDRQNFISFQELREHLGFSLRITPGKIYINRHNANMNDYFLFGEMIINIITGLENENIIYPYSEDRIIAILDTLDFNINKVGFKVKQNGNQYLIVKNNTVAIEVADMAPDLADVIIEYNHYLLKGDLNRKQEILKKIADM